MLTGNASESRKVPARALLAAAACAPLLAGCVQTQWQSAGYAPGQTLRTADQMMDQELADRVRRLDRLSQMQGVTPPQIQQFVLPPDPAAGFERPIPVIRVTFAERGFFAPGGASPSAAASQVLHAVAQNMQRDVPDVRVTVLGHTDATGSFGANMAVSQARAQAVVQALVSDGVNPAQLTAVAIGDGQPIAPNATAGGRAENRRVEFVISPSEAANLAAISRQPVNRSFMALGGSAPPAARTQVTLLKPRYAGPADFSEAPDAPRPAGAVKLTAAGELPIGITGSPVNGDPVSPLAASKASFQPVNR